MLLILALNIQLSAFSQRAGGQGTTSTGFAKRVEDLIKISEKSRAYYLKNKWKEQTSALISMTFRFIRIEQDGNYLDILLYQTNYC